MDAARAIQDWYFRYLDRWLDKQEFEKVSRLTSLQAS